MAVRLYAPKRPGASAGGKANRVRATRRVLAGVTPGKLWPWAVVALWLLALGPVFAAATGPGRGLVDFRSYQLPAAALLRGESPYVTPAAALAVWRAFHDAEAALLAASAGGQGAEQLRALAGQPLLPGPYVYPPTLALLVAQLHPTDRVFAVVLGLAIVGFAWLWLRSTGAAAAWLLLVIGSWDVLASWTGGNVEHLLLFATLLAALLLWTRQGFFASLPIAFVLLIKPYYALFFAAFVLLQLRGAPPAARRAVLRTHLAAAFGALLLIALEVERWGPRLRAEALDYLRTATERLWLVLPVAGQTPMSAWNRTPLQALIVFGLPPRLAEGLALALWVVLLGVTLWRVSPARLTWARAWALALVLLYLGRPVGWGLIYLDLIVLTTLWSRLATGPRLALLAAAVALQASHWAALALTAQGRGLPLLTLQSAALPWETVLVLPLCWALLLFDAARPPAGAGTARPGPARSGGPGRPPGPGSPGRTATMLPADG